MPPTKRTKRDVAYQPGQPPDGEYCEICTHYIPIAGEAPECRCVLGTISWRGWCRLWKEADARTQQSNREAR